MQNTRFLALVIALTLLTSGCQPIQPATPPLPTSVSDPVAADATALADNWEGRIAVAGLNLTIFVTFTSIDGGPSGTIDIPEQGAAGIPLNNITLDPPAIRFEMLAGPQLAVFSGEIAADGTISGSFAQAGVEGTFDLAPLDAPTATALAPATAPTPEETYTDPAGLFSVPIPTNWLLSTEDGVTTLTSPEESIHIHLLALEDADSEAAISTAWQRVDPTFDLEIDEIATPPAPPGVERLVSITYNDPADDQRIVLGQSQLHEGISYVLLLDAQLVGLQQRNAQVQIIGSGFTILALDEVDLADVEPLLVDETLLAQLEAYIEETIARYQIPGAAVAIVQNGEVVYAEGFGVRDPATGEPITPETLMRIGSTGKSLTTLLMATLVDDGLMEWDTPASEILPTFAVNDPELSHDITMRNLVCACTGVPRRDFELIFNADEMSAEDTVASLQTFDFFTDFGEAFQYSNQMVATAGYLAGLAAGGPADDLMTGYVTALQERVLEPIGMVDTTLWLDVVEASDNYAIPHAVDFDFSYEPMPLEIERLLDPVAPAGAHWSTLDDMARYLITQLAQGVAPDGAQVVSAQNLAVTREPQVAVTANTSYGLGWLVGEYKGQPLISHGGNTFGFTSDFAFLPDAGLGIVVLTNAQGSNLFNDGVRTRLFELVFEQEAEADAQLQFAYEQLRQANEEVVGRMVETVETGAVEPFVGLYQNQALGELSLTLEDGELWLDAGEFRSGLLPLLDEAGERVEGYLLLDPPLKGMLVKLERDEDDRPILVFGEGVIQYTFEPIN